MEPLKEHIKPIELLIRKNKNFVYKGKKYPVDFSLIKKYSIFFYKNKSNFKQINDIDLKPDNYQISDEAISAFISCCQNEPFDITDSNVFSLHQLSIQYEVPVLKNFTTQFIAKNKNPLVFQSIFYKLENRKHTSIIDLVDEEEIISSNFFDFINDEQLLSLPIQVLYRIINNEKLQINSMNSTNQNQFIDFLFKCLDKYKREASILFANLDLGSARIDVLSRLLNTYSDIFDFNFINSEFLAKNTSFLLSEFKKLNINFTNKISEIDGENQKQREFFVSTQKSFDETISKLLESNHSLEEKLVEIEKEHAKQITKMQEEHAKQITKMQEDQKNQIGQIQIELNELKKQMQEDQKNQIAQIQSELNEQKRKLSRYVDTKVSKIEINSDSDLGTKMILSASVEPNYAFNDGVEWQINQDDQIVEVETKNKKTLVLKRLKVSNTKVTVVATALDGSGVTAELKIKCNSFVFGYTGRVELVELEAGNYKLEAWGAQGGSVDETYYGGYGGYSTGVINLKSKTKIFVVVGQSTKSTNGGFNGGGSGGIFNCSEYKYTSLGGGGASHVGLKSGVLSSFLLDYQNQLLIVASGGGGSNDGYGRKNAGMIPYFGVGGCGGGCTGAVGKSSENESYRLGAGGTQSCGGKAGTNWSEKGSFGRGASCGHHSCSILGGGGGSGLYGGGCGGCGGPGAGGSGFINTAKLTEAFMYGYEVPTSSSVESKTFSTTNVSSDAISNYAKQGDGYVRIIAF